MLLPKRIDIDKAKKEELRKEIDSGVQLATKIDKLRETASSEEKQLQAWREESIRIIQLEIANFIEERDNLEKQNNEARALRNERLKPLDHEWLKLNLAKQSFNTDRETLNQEIEMIENHKKVIEIKKKELSELITKAKSNQDETERAKVESISFKELAEREYATAQREHERGTALQEQKMSVLQESEREYQVALSLVEIRENAVKDKESELITRENDLARRLARLERVEK